MLLALKTFFRAFKDPEGARRFLNKKVDDCAATSVMGLSLLQKQGRLVDFLQEDISKFSDSQIGAAARKIQQDCHQALKKWLTIKPVIDEAEGQAITVPLHYDTSKIKVVGRVKGTGPYQGIVRHRGWRVENSHLANDHMTEQVIYPAEVEVVS